MIKLPGKESCKILYHSFFNNSAIKGGGKGRAIFFPKAKVTTAIRLEVGGWGLNGTAIKKE